MSLSLVFENSEVLIFNKPTGLSSDIDVSAPETVLTLAQKEWGENCRLVHRLDKETSGLIVVAKSREAAALYMSFFEKRFVTKRYHAVLCGTPQPNTGSWDQSLSDKAEGRSNPQGDGVLISARTDYSVIQNNPFFSLVEFDLHTGRTHQIRRHAVLNRHAIFGDERYGNSKYFEKMYTRYGVRRMCLQSSFIEFPQKAIKVELSVPDSFQALTRSV